MNEAAAVAGADTWSDWAHDVMDTAFIMAAATTQLLGHAGYYVIEQISPTITASAPAAWSSSSSSVSSSSLLDQLTVLFQQHEPLLRDSMDRIDSMLVSMGGVNNDWNISTILPTLLAALAYAFVSCSWQGPLWTWLLGGRSRSATRQQSGILGYIWMGLAMTGMALVYMFGLVTMIFMVGIWTVVLVHYQYEPDLNLPSCVLAIGIWLLAATLSSIVHDSWKLAQTALRQTVWMLMSCMIRAGAFVVRWIVRCIGVLLYLPILIFINPILQWVGLKHKTNQTKPLYRANHFSETDCNDEDDGSDYDPHNDNREYCYESNSSRDGIDDDDDDNNDDVDLWLSSDNTIDPLDPTEVTALLLDAITPLESLSIWDRSDPSSSPSLSLPNEQGIYDNQYHGHLSSSRRRRQC